METGKVITLRPLEFKLIDMWNDYADAIFEFHQECMKVSPEELLLYSRNNESSFVRRYMLTKGYEERFILRNLAI